jgi:hypothetical protein
MALFADLCPHCQKITRCHVKESVSVAGGLLFGIPFILPWSSVTCFCGECGSEFHSESWDHEKTVSPAEAEALDIEALLSRTNPRLKETLALAELRATPQLCEAFQILGQLTPGSLRTGLKDTLQQWARLDRGQQDRFLAKVHDCSEALRFARLMAGRYTTGAVGCLAGVLGCVGVWSACLLLVPRLNVLGWVAIAAAGLVAGGLLCQLFWSKRNRRWVTEVLMPEAQRSGIHLGTLLAVLEDGIQPTRAEDELRTLRELAPTIRAELPSSGMAGDATPFDFGVLQP